MFAGTATFGSFTVTSNGDNDMFVAKYDAAGAAQWVINAGGTRIDEGNKIATDATGNIYVAGLFQDSISFGNTLLTGSASFNVFIVKLDAAGNVMWATQSVGTGSISCSGLAADNNGNCYLSGNFMHNTSFQGFALTNSGYSDAYIVKFNAAGVAEWAVQSTGQSDKNSPVLSVDGSGNSFIAGTYEGVATFGNITLTNNGPDKGFVVKYNQAGVVQWAKQTQGNEQQSATAISADLNGNCFVSGNFFGNISLGSTTLTSNGNADIYLVKYNASGDVQWAAKGGGPNYEEAMAIATDENGNSYISGHFWNNSSTFGNFTLTNNNPNANKVFVVKYNAAGAVQWATQISGFDGERVYGIALNGSGNSYITGSFGGTAAFGSTTLTTPGDYDIYIAKLGSLTALYDIYQPASMVAYPNPFHTSFSISNTGTEPAEAVLTDMLGREVHRQIILQEAATTTALITPPATLCPGVYLIQLEQGGVKKLFRVVKQ